MKKHYNLIFCKNCKYLIDGYMGSDWCDKIVNYTRTSYMIRRIHVDKCYVQNKRNNCRYYKPNFITRFKNFISRRNCKC